MVDKVTLDFENGLIIWDCASQQGTEHCPDLAARKPAILAAMGYEAIDFTSALNTINAFVNGEISEEEFEAALEQETAE